MTHFDMVREFMEAFGQEVKTSPEFPTQGIADLRYELIAEEVKELLEGMLNFDVVEIADALTDILYVAYGAGHAFGVDLQDLCTEESNTEPSSFQSILSATMGVGISIRAKSLNAIQYTLTDLIGAVYKMGEDREINLHACFTEVQRSNMSKLGEDGKPIRREDGKILKGPNYSEPNLEFVRKVV